MKYGVLLTKEILYKKKLGKPPFSNRDHGLLWTDDAENVKVWAGPSPHHPDLHGLPEWFPVQRFR